jgi:transcriptional regulator with XRE-family HTH domain
MGEAPHSSPPHPTDLQVGRRLRQRRTLLGMSQGRLGGLLGVTYQQIQKYERGANRIGSSRLHDLARILGVLVAYFFDAPLPPAGFQPALGDSTGLAEGASAFVHDVPAADLSPPQGDADPGDVVGSRETLELVRAFNRIGDPQVRRRLLDLARSLAAVTYRQAGRDDPVA